MRYIARRYYVDCRVTKGFIIYNKNKLLYFIFKFNFNQNNLSAYGARKIISMKHSLHTPEM